MTTRHESEIDRLRQWKSSAIELLNEWDKVWDAAGRPGPLGGSKAANVLRVLADRKQGPDTMTHTHYPIGAPATCTRCGQPIELTMPDEKDPTP